MPKKAFILIFLII